MTEAKKLKSISRALVRRFEGWQCPAPVTHVYNPLDYARTLHEGYLDRFGDGRGRVLLLGMNPGPWGMAQTGVPFGEVAAVRDWMGLRGKVRPVPHVHPARPVLGLECTRSEVSGARLWGWARKQYPRPEAFFERFFVLNYCPLLFLRSTGERSATNVTPDKIAIEARREVTEVCDAALRDVVVLLQPSHVIGVGAYAAKRAREVLADHDDSLRFGQVLHPSPASPAANRGWEEVFERQLEDLGIGVR